MASETKVGDLLTCPIYKDARDVWFDGTKICAPSPDSARRLSAELSAAREMREVLSGCVTFGRPCPWCEWDTALHLKNQGHAPDCRLARLIGGGE